jgi:hypothetical protein
MKHGDLLAVLWCRIPTKTLLDLSAAIRHIESVGTLCSVAGQIMIRWCGANHLHESPGSRCRTFSCPGVSSAGPFHPTMCFTLHEYTRELCRGKLPQVPWATGYGPKLLDTTSSLQRHPLGIVTMASHDKDRSWEAGSSGVGHISATMRSGKCSHDVIECPWGGVQQPGSA